MVATQFHKELHSKLYRRLLRKHGLNARVPRKKLFISKKNKVLRSRYVSKDNLLTVIIFSRVQYSSLMNISLIFW